MGTTNSEDNTNILINLSVEYINMMNYGEAEQCLLKCQSIYESIYGKNNSKSKQIYNILMLVYSKMENSIQKAQGVSKKIYEI